MDQKSIGVSQHRFKSCWLRGSYLWNIYIYIYMYIHTLTSWLPRWLSHNMSTFQLRRHRRLSSVPGMRRSSGGVNGNPLQYLAWRIPWTEEPGRPHFIGSQRVRYSVSNWACTHTHAHTHTHTLIICATDDKASTAIILDTIFLELVLFFCMLSEQGSSTIYTFCSVVSFGNSRKLKVAQTMKNPHAMQETWVWSLGWEEVFEKGMATHSSVLAPMDRGSCWAIVHGVTKSQTQLSDCAQQRKFKGLCRQC